MNHNIVREVTPLTQSDCFTIFSRVKKRFDFPLHYHDEYELNLILNAKGAKRIVGDHVGILSDMELVFVGPNLSHAWFTHECRSEMITEITIQFHRDFIDEKMLARNQLSFIRNMFRRTQNGLLFSEETIKRIKGRIMSLNKKQGFDSVLELMSILHDLSVSRNMLTLSDASASSQRFNYDSRRLEQAFAYMHANYSEPITLAQVSAITHMKDVSFSRFIKKRTGYTFIECLNEIRIGHASRLLIDTTSTIAEIAYKVGFNNISNFNRIFKKRKGATPREFRENFAGSRTFI